MGCTLVWPSANDTDVSAGLWLPCHSTAAWWRVMANLWLPCYPLPSLHSLLEHLPFHLMMIRAGLSRSSGNLMQCRTNYNMKSRQWTWLTMTNYYIKSKQGTDPAGVVGCKWSKANGATADCQEESTKLQKKQTKDEAWLSAKHKAMQQNKYPSIKETKGKWWSQGCPSPCLVESGTKSWAQLMNGSSS